MPVNVQNETEPPEPLLEDKPRRTVVGWQGLRCVLPPDWNVTGLSMDRENGYLRIDAPGNSTVAVQIRWSNAAKPDQGAPTGYQWLAPKFRKLLRRPEPVVPKPDLKANLERLLKESAKDARKSKASFDSNSRTEKVEGEAGERTAMHFSWTGAGRGQGKIWYCSVCHRIVIAQVVGMPKDQAAMSAVASQLFATLRDHSEDGYDLWALYDLHTEIPEDFRLEAQKVLSGHLHLSFGRNGERIVLERWGLANMTRKKFTLREWLGNNALENLKPLTHTQWTSPGDHLVERYEGPMNLFTRLRALREARTSLRRFPSRYEGGIWECDQTNRIFTVQVLTSTKTQGLWEKVVSRCLCH